MKFILWSVFCVVVFNLVKYLLTSVDTSIILYIAAFSSTVVIRLLADAVLSALNPNTPYKRVIRSMDQLDRMRNRR